MHGEGTSAVKIRSIETHLVGNPWKVWLFARVLTDDGVHGVGEGTLGHLHQSVEGAIHDFSPLVVGRDPFDVEAIVQTLSRDVYADGGQIKMAAIAAIEIGCWDIIGKTLGQPIYRLLGGRCHERLRAYANGWYRCEGTPEAFADRARKVVAMGYTALKFDPFGVGWRTLTLRDEDLAVDIVRAVREAVGPHVDLMIEAHSRFGVSSAIRMGNRLAEFNPAWFEEPVPHHNTQMTIEVARAIPVPVATGESVSSKHAVAELLRHGVIQIVQLEPLHLGGLFAARKIADMVDAHYGVIAPHAASSPVSTVACMHLDASTPCFYIQEYFHDFDLAWEHDLVINHPVCRNGFIEIPSGVGLGVDLDMDVVRQHPWTGETDINLFEEDWHKRRDNPG